MGKFRELVLKNSRYIVPVGYSLIRNIRVENSPLRSSSDMPSIFSHETLNLKVSKSSPSLRGILYFFLSLPLVLLAAEIVARSPLGSSLPAPSVNADSFLFDAKIYSLEQQVRRNGGLDCLFLGSSVANVDINPEVVEQVYLEQTGETIHCFNLGLPAMTIENATAIADAAIARFQPKVIFYTILSRDIDHVTASVNFIEQSNWLKFNRGKDSLNGWLVNHSYAWRYFLTWRYWLVTPNRAKMDSETIFLTPKGFQPAQGINDPYPENQTMTPERLMQIWDDPGHAQVVNDFLALQQKGVTLVFIEGPVYRDPNANTWPAYEADYIPPLQSLLETGGVPFWRTDAIAVQIQKPNWYDWLHLNSQGAVTFSQWLGEVMAENKNLFK